jgi:hypothetical protein
MASVLASLNDVTQTVPGLVVTSAPPEARLILDGKTLATA